MSLTGAMSAAVTGLSAQSSAIAISSDNIANVNTIGYKNVQGFYETIVTDSGGSGYSPGGVVLTTRQVVDKQGLFQATDIETDIAISGEGFFVVSSEAQSAGEIRYTRAGSFRTDNEGNLVNSAGFYLQAWPLDSSGLLPGEPGNTNTTSSAELSSLESVNISQTGGTVQATTSVALGANLDAKQELFNGAGATATMDINNSINYTDFAADNIIIPDTAGAVNLIAAGDEFEVTTSTGISQTFVYGGFDASGTVAVGTPMFDATSETDAFFGNPTTPPTGANATFTISNPTSGTVTFTYVTSTPNEALGQFNSLSNLATAIDLTPGLTARTDGNGTLYIAAEDQRESVTFADGGTTTWVATLGLTDVASTANNRFATLGGLSTIIEDISGLSSSLNTPLTKATLDIRVADPLATITFTDDPNSTNTGSLLEELGITDAMALGGPFAAQTTGIINPTYDSTGTNGDNMASGTITPHYTRTIRVVDSLGTGHDIRVSFLKIGENLWTVELYAADDDDLSSTLVDGQIATGRLTFNGDGTLRAVSNDLAVPITISWTNGAEASEIMMDWGTAGVPVGTTGATVFGLADGVSQFDGEFGVSFINQDGSEYGTLISIDIDKEGFVSASYTNGSSQKLYKIPLADFTNPNGLDPLSGNVYEETSESGSVFLREPGANSVGTIASSSLEASNVDLAKELTNMIVAQRAYQANTRAITTADELMEELTRL